MQTAKRGHFWNFYYAYWQSGPVMTHLTVSSMLFNQNPPSHARLPNSRSMEI